MWLHAQHHPELCWIIASQGHHAFELIRYTNSHLTAMKPLLISHQLLARPKCCKASMMPPAHRLDACKHSITDFCQRCMLAALHWLCTSPADVAPNILPSSSSRIECVHKHQAMVGPSWSCMFALHATDSNSSKSRYASYMSRTYLF